MKRKGGSFNNFKHMREELLLLRSGELSLAALRKRVRPVLARLAAYWHRRYEGRQTLLEREDLVSMGEVAVWRAVDTWDPARRAIEDYVLCEVGRAMEKPLKAAAGWPDPRRREPLKPIYFADMNAPCTMGDREGGAREVWKKGMWKGSHVRAMMVMEFVSTTRCAPSPSALEGLERREQALEAIEGLSDGFGQIVAQLVLKGYTIQGAGEAMYGSPRLRRFYGLRDVAHARRAAAAAAVRVRRELAGSGAMM